MSKLLSVFLLLVLAACSGGHDIAAVSQTAERLPFQDWQGPPQPRGGNCEDTIDPAAPLISNGFGFDLRNTRSQASVITADNVAQLRVNYRYVQDGVTEMRGAAAVTAQAIFFTAGNRLIALNRTSGCRYWTVVGNSSFRSSSILLVPANGADSAMVITADYNGQVVAHDIANGRPLWQAFAGTDAGLHFVTGGMQYHDGKLLVPVSSKEVVLGAFTPDKPCCSSHGMLVAFDALRGERLWEYHATAAATEVVLPGERVGPNGAAIWSTPTIDAARNVIYLGTGQNYTEPTTDTSDAIISLDLGDGSVNWIFQATANDAWNYGCQQPGSLRCPVPEGHDFDFGAPPILVDDGRTLIAGDKGGAVYAIDADNGALRWSRKLSIGSWLGGIHWGMAADDHAVYAAATDFEIDPASGEREDLKPGANPGIYALELSTGELLWEIHPTRRYRGLDTPVLYSAALALTNDVLFAGSLDGVVSAFAAADGAELWSFDSAIDVVGIDGATGHGGTIDGAGVVVAGDGLLIGSGYGTLFGGVGRYQAGEGNVLFMLQLPAE